MRDGAATTDPREAWRTFAANYHLFRATPSRLWLDHLFVEMFRIDVRLEAATADLYFDAIGDALARPEFRPRALFDRSGSISSRPPKARTTTSPTTRRSAPRVGAGAS